MTLRPKLSMAGSATPKLQQREKGDTLMEEKQGNIVSPTTRGGLSAGTVRGMLTRQRQGLSLITFDRSGAAGGSEPAGAYRNAHVCL